MAAKTPLREKKPFLETIPGVMTAAAGLITGIAGLLAAVHEFRKDGLPVKTEVATDQSKTAGEDGAGAQAGAVQVVPAGVTARSKEPAPANRTTETAAVEPKAADIEKAVPSGIRAVSVSSKILVKMLAAPKLDAEVVGVLGPSQVIYLNGRAGEWWLVTQENGKRGYVLAQFVKSVN